MSIGFVQIVTLAIYAILGVLAGKTRKPWVRITIVILALVIFMFNPLKFKHESMSKIERRSSKISEELPKRIVPEMQLFEEKQATEMAKLKFESKEILNNEKN